MLNSDQALAFIERHGVVLVSAQGALPRLTEAIAGEPIRGSWWGHAKGREIFRALNAVYESPDVVALKLNLDFSRLALLPGTTGLTIGNLTLCNMSTLPSLNGLTVAQVLPIANTLLGGGTASFSIADLDPVIADINGSFDGGIVSPFAQDHLFNGACP